MPHGAIPFPFGNCRICDDRATGIHYGAATCEGCKGFFKRSLPKRDKFACFFGGHCTITRFNRNRCKACRLQRCLDNGMAVEAVKMGRIPKLEKERALCEAHCTLAAAPGSGDDDVEDMDHGEHGKVTGQGDGFPNYPGVGVTSALAMSDRYSGPNCPTVDCSAANQPSSQTAPNLYKGLTRQNGFIHGCLKNRQGLSINGDLEYYSRGMGPLGTAVSSPYVDGFTTDRESGALMAPPWCSRQGSAPSSLYSCSGQSRRSMSNQEPRESSGTWNAQAGVQRKSSRFPQHPVPFLSSSSISKSSPASSLVHCTQNSVTGDKISSKGVWARNKDNWKVSGSLHQPILTKIKSEVLDVPGTRSEQQNDIQGEKYSPKCIEYNQKVSLDFYQAGLSKFHCTDFAQPISCMEQTSPHQNSVKQFGSQRSKEMSFVDTIQSSNPFAEPKTTDAIAKPSQLRWSYDQSTCKLLSFENGSPTSECSSAVGIQNDAHSKDARYPCSDSNGPVLPTPCQLSHATASASYSNRSFTNTSDSGCDNKGSSKPDGSTSPASPGGCGKRTAYSPDVVKVLLNQVGGERLKGLKQHIMTSIAPVCCPEEFQAAADLLTQYSQVSGAAAGHSDRSNSGSLPGHSDRSTCGSLPGHSDRSDSGSLPDQHGYDCVSFKSDREVQMCSSNTRIFDEVKSEPLTETSTPHALDFCCKHRSPKAENQSQLATNEITHTIKFGDAAPIAQGMTESNPAWLTKDTGHLLESPAEKAASTISCNRYTPSSAGADLAAQVAQATHHSVNATPTDFTNTSRLELVKSSGPGPSYQGSHSTGSGNRSGTDLCLYDLGADDMLSGTCGKGFCPRDHTHSSNDRNTLDQDNRHHTGTDSDTSNLDLQGASTEDLCMAELASTLSTSFDTHMALFKLWHAEMQRIIKSGEPLPVHPMIPEAKAIVYEQLIGSIGDINKAIIGFCNSVPGVSNLPKADKDYLTKRAYYDLWMLVNSRLFHEGQTYLRLPDGTYYNRDWMEVILNKEIVQVFFNFSVAFNGLGLSDLEVAILCAIQLTSPGNECPGVSPISCRERVEHINSQLVDLLVLEVGRKHVTSGPRILVDIFRLLPDLAEINTLQQEIIANFAADTAPENVNYSPKPAPLADLPEEQLNAVLDK